MLLTYTVILFFVNGFSINRTYSSIGRCEFNYTVKDFLYSILGAFISFLAVAPFIYINL